MLRARANGETFVSATMCRQQCVLVCQGLKRYLDGTSLLLTAWNADHLKIKRKFSWNGRHPLISQNLLPPWFQTLFSYESELRLHSFTYLKRNPLSLPSVIVSFPSWMWKPCVLQGGRPEIYTYMQIGPPNGWKRQRCKSISHVKLEVTSHSSTVLNGDAGDANLFVICCWISSFCRWFKKYINALSFIHNHDEILLHVITNWQKS